MRRIWLTFGIALLLAVFGLGSTALAHATLKQALPLPGAALDKAPLAVSLQFNEEVEAQFGAIAVYDQNGARVDKGDARLDPTDVTTVTASLKPLKDGLYTVTYRVISADGHPVSGSYGFTVGHVDGGATAPVTGQTGNDGRPPLPVLAGYWLGAAGLMLLAGLALTQLLVVRAAPGPGYRGWLWAAWGAALAGTLLYLVSRTAQAADISMVGALNPGLLWQMLLTRTGLAILARLLLLALTPLLFTRHRTLGLGLGALELLTLAMGGHAVALSQPWLGVTLDWVHLLAAAAWAGGLIQLAFLVDRSAETLRLGELVARFSPVAAISVALLAGTGLYPALLHIPSPAALVQTTYGWALLVKLALVALLLLLGAANLIAIGPALRRGRPVGGRFRRVVTAEAALMACVLGAAALLTNVAPARAAMPPATLNVGIHSQRNAALLQMAPLSPGYHTLDVTIAPHEGTVGPDTQVTLELIMKTHDMGKNVTTGKYVGDGHFRFEQVLIGMAGPWEFRLTVTQPNADPDLLTITVDVPEGL